MGEAVSIILIALLIFFVLGVVSGVVAINFLRKKKHPVLTVVLAILCLLGVYIPVQFVMGFMVARAVLVLLGAWVIYVIVKVIRETNWRGHN